MLHCVSCLMLVSILTLVSATEHLKCRTNNDCIDSQGICMQGECSPFPSQKSASGNSLNLLRNLLNGRDIFSSVQIGESCHNNSDCQGILYGLNPTLSADLNFDLSTASTPMVCSPSLLICDCPMGSIWNGYFCSVRPKSFNSACVTSSDCDTSSNLYCDPQAKKCLCEPWHRFNGIKCSLRVPFLPSNVQTFHYSVLGTDKTWCNEDSQCQDHLLCNNTTNVCYCPDDHWKKDNRCFKPRSYFPNRLGAFPVTIPMLTFIIFLIVIIPICCRFALNFVRHNVFTSNSSDSSRDWLTGLSLASNRVAPGLIPHINSPPPSYDQVAPPNYEDALKHQVVGTSCRPQERSPV